MPLILLVVISDATLHSFGAPLEGRIIHDSIDQYPDPVALVKRNAAGDATLAVRNPLPQAFYLLLPNIKKQKLTFPQSLQNFYSRYKNLVGSRRIQEIRSFEEKVKELQRKSEDELTSKYVVGLELKPGEAIAFFSPLAFHAGPTSFSLVLNSFLQIVDSDLSATFEAHAIVSETNV